MTRLGRTSLLAVTAALLLSSMQVSAKPIDVRFWTPFGAEPNKSVLDQIIADFQKENPSIRVTHVVPATDGTEFFEKVLVGMAGGTGPDIIWAAPDRVSPLYGTAAVVPLSQLEKIGGSIGLSDFYKGLTNPKNQYQKKMWGVPFENGNLALYWNKAMFAKAGIGSPPKTWSEMTEMAMKLTSATDNVAGYESRYWDWYMPMWLAQKGTALVNDGATKIAWTDKAAIEAIKWYTDLQVKYKSAQPIKFKNKQAAMLISGTWDYQTVKTAKIDFGIAPVPVADNGVPATVSTYKELVVMSKGTQTVAASWKFLKYLMSDEVYVKWCLATNYLPVKRSQTKLRAYQRYLDASPGMQTFLDQADFGTVTPPFRGSLSVLAVFQSALDQIIGGKATVEQAMGDAAQRAQAFLKK